MATELKPVREVAEPAAATNAYEQPAIGSYAAIGDGRSVALVGHDGAIDWLAWPRFDDDPAFAALVDPGRGGRFALGALRTSHVERRYVDGTNVLASRITTDGGIVTVFDFMPVTETRVLRPAEALVRCIRCDDGSAEVLASVDVASAFESRRAPVRVRDRGALGIRFDTGRGLHTLRADWPLEVTGGTARGRVALRAGDEVAIALAFDERAPATLPVVGRQPWRELEETIAVWQRWSRRAHVPGASEARRALVLRSALALKLLVHAPSGAVVAAPTTSLPERIGAGENWDYRYCWLRDASMTVRVLLGIGFDEEAAAFVDWMLHATRLSFPDLHILYDVYGRAPQPERTLALPGYRGSRPVRVGNAARDQLQLDVFGEVIDAAAQLAVHRGRLEHDAARFLLGLGRRVYERWREPDHGIWEPRGAPVPHTHSRLLCWVALDRLLDLDRRGLVCLHDRGAVLRERQAIRDDIEEHAFSPRLSSYVGSLGGDEVDATALLLPYYGFEDASSPRMRATFEALERDLGAGGALLRRNRSIDEGAFGICSFWRVEYLARGGGSLDDAERSFEQLASYANDVGLFAEEIDPATGAALGNFPQAFTHVGLVSAALAIEERRNAEASCSG
jgi:GH15 family glucan-1,4-alpha-glucosidase